MRRFNSPATESQVPLTNAQIAEIFGRLKLGEREAWNEFFKGIFGDIVKYVVRYYPVFRDDAEDIAIETLQALHVKLPGLQELTIAYVLKRAQLICRERLRRAYFRHHKGTLDQPALNQIADSDSIDQFLSSILKDIWSAAENLPPPQPEILRLRYCEKLNYTQIAERLQLSQSTVVRQHNDAVETLARLFRED